MKPVIRVQDVLLLLMFAALMVLAHNNLERGFLAALAALQLVEGRIAWLGTVWGRATSVLLQLLLCYLLLGWTATLNSEYYPVLLLPVMSTATYMGFTGTLLVSAATIGAYLSFLWFVDWTEMTIDAEAIHMLEVRCVLLALAAILVNSLGEARRRESARYKKAAEQLSIANQHLLDAEDEVRRSERLAALGQLSAGLAHELRNPLGSIRGSAELLTRATSPDNAVARELAEIIREEVDRTNALVTRFLDFARPLEPRRESVDITTVIDRAATHAGDGQVKLQIIRNYSPDVRPLSIDPALMEQVFINLLTNAVQASATNAPVTVATRVCGDEAEITVIDRGCGIPPDKIDTIFNPFVTNKQGGTGLGLAIVARIIDGHGGRITVESDLGKGSTFRIYLPSG
ncbi:MAG: two-component system, NtrC family, sensor histidine kinase HydH [Bryobacterales bacterium]|nr:two-component system, NtrC family, sensor histidine kinase HydH [Bryobacterales bacterium]